jgi:pimeloyl-ACP methyl ester carboxylesterase
VAARDDGGDPVSDEEWARVFAVFGPSVPAAEALARRLPNPALGERGMQLFRRFHVVDRLARVGCPTLVCVGELDPVTPVAAAWEIHDALPAGMGRLEVIEGAGHFPWLDLPERYWPLLTEFVAKRAW